LTKEWNIFFACFSRTIIAPCISKQRNMYAYANLLAWWSTHIKKVILLNF